MKTYVIKAHGEYKVGDPLEVQTYEQLETLSKDGFVVTAAEWAGMEAQKAAKATIRAQQVSQIDKAIMAGIEREALVPKGDASNSAETVRARCLAQIDKGVDVDFAVQVIEGMPGKVQAAAANLGRQTPFVNEQSNHSIEVSASLADASKAVVRATEPQNQLCRSGKWTEALKLSREASSIMAKHHIKPIKAGADFMFRDMFPETIKAQTFTDPNSQVGSLAGDLILMRNLGYLVNKLAWLPKLTTNLSGEPVQFGQSILTRYITPPGVLTWVPGVGFTSDAATIAAAGAGTTQSGATTQATGTVTKSVPSTTDRSVVLNMFKATEIEFPVSLLAGTVRPLFAEQLGAQTYSLAEEINKYVLATMFAATWTGAIPGYVKALGNFNISSLVDLKTNMTVNKIPDVGRFALLHTFYHDKLLQDTNLLNAKAILSLINKDTSAFESGVVPPLFGVQPLESQLASATSAGALTTWTNPEALGDTNIIGFAGNMSSMLFVTRPPQDWTSTLAQLGIPTTASVRLMTEPDSGLTVMVFSYADNGKMSISQRVCLMWGAAQGDPRVGFPIKALA